MPACLRALAVAALLLASLPRGAGGETEDLLFFRRLVASGLEAPAAAQMETWLAAQPGHPERAEVAHLLGETSLALGRPAGALAGFGLFAELAPGDPRAAPGLLAAVDAGSRAGLFAESEPLSRRLLLDYPDFAARGEALLLGARLAAGRGEATLALALLDQLLAGSETGERVGRALFERAQLRSAADPAAARADLSALRQRLPEHPLAAFAALTLAEQALAAGDEAGALAELAWVLAHFEEDELVGRALALRATLHEEAGRPAAAAADLATRRRRLPALPAEFPREIGLLLAAGQPADALALAHLEQSMVGPTPATLLRLAEAAAAAGDEAGALDALSRAAAADPAGALGLDALERRFALLAGRVGAEPAAATAALEAAARDLLARLGDPAARARLVVALGDAAARWGQGEAARRAWEQAALEPAAGEPAAEALARLARAAERAGDGPRALALHNRLLTEQGASALAAEAARRRELLARYYPADREAALARLLAAMREQERAADAGEAAEREQALRVGQLLLEDFKDYPTAVEHFGRLAARAAAGEGRAEALLAAGRAARYEAERLALASGPQGAAPAAWRARARSELAACLAEAAPGSAAAARGELALLALGELPADADRLPALDALLAASPPGPELAPYYYERAELRRTRPGAGADQLALGLADAERALALASALASAGEPWAARAQLCAGRLALAAGDSAAAAGRFAALLAASPGGAEAGEAHFELGRLEAGARHPQQALEHFEAFARLAPASPRRALGRLWQGDCQFRLGAWAAAADCYRQLLEGLPSEEGVLADAARYRLALCAEREGDGEAAAAWLVQVLAGGDARLQREAAWRLGSAAAADGRAEAAIELLDRLRGPGARAVEGGLLRGRLLLAGRQGEAASAHYAALLAEVDLGAARAGAEAESIQALLLAGRRQAAGAAWAELSARPGLEPADAAAVRLAFGRERLAAGEDAAAERHFAQCLQEHPDTPAAVEARGERALLALRRGELAAAEADLALLAACCPESAATARLAEQLAVALASRGDWAGAAAHFETCLALTAEPGPELLHDAAQAFAQAGRGEEALAAVERFLAGWPGDARAAEARLQRGRLLQELGDAEAAILAYREAELYLLGDAESRARLGFWVGDCLEALGEGEAAIGAFLRVGTRFPDQGLWGLTALLRAAALHEAAGARAEARRLYTQVLAAAQAPAEIAESAAAGLARLDAREARP